MMRQLWVAAISAVAALSPAHAAQPIDCATPVAKAEKAVEKVTGDLQGMDKTMARSEMSQIHGLVTSAEKLLKEARQDCRPQSAAYDEARAVARADAADGYATAADMLHFHYMETMGNAGGMGSTSMEGAMAPRRGGSTAMPGMPGMNTR
jgi:hypothetical protein